MTTRIIEGTLRKSIFGTGLEIHDDKGKIIEWGSFQDMIGKRIRITIEEMEDTPVFHTDTQVAYESCDPTVTEEVSSSARSTGGCGTTDFI